MAKLYEYRKVDSLTNEKETKFINDVNDIEDSKEENEKFDGKKHVVWYFFNTSMRNRIEDAEFSFEFHAFSHGPFSGEPVFKVHITHKESGYSATFRHKTTDIYKRIVADSSSNDAWEKTADSLEAEYMSAFEWITEWSPVFVVYLLDGSTIEYELQTHSCTLSGEALVIMSSGRSVATFAPGYWARWIRYDKLKDYLEYLTSRHKSIAAKSYFKQ